MNLFKALCEQLDNPTLLVLLAAGMDETQRRTLLLDLRDLLQFPDRLNTSYRAEWCHDVAIRLYRDWLHGEASDRGNETKVSEHTGTKDSEDKEQVQWLVSRIREASALIKQECPELLESLNRANRF